jgi:hypothetical protein
MRGCGDGGRGTRRRQVIYPLAGWQTSVLRPAQVRHGTYGTFIRPRRVPPLSQLKHLSNGAWVPRGIERDVSDLIPSF